MTKRISYFDMLRGIAIIFVVIIHSSGAGFRFPVDSFDFNFTVILRQIFVVSVPLFIAISGYFLAKKSISTYREYFAFLKKQIPKIYIPFFFWSGIWFVLLVVVLQKPLGYELMKLITFQSFGPYYFIALIIQYYILLPILKKLANFRGLIISLLISLVAVGVVFYASIYLGLNLPLIVYAGNFPIFLVFFVLGLYLGSLEKITMSNKSLISLVVMFYLLSCVEAYSLNYLFKDIQLTATGIKASSYMFSIFLIILLFKNIDFFKSKTLEFLGKISFGIYLTHVFLLAIIPPLINKLFPSLIEVQVFYQFLLFFVTLSSCVLMIIVGRKILPAKIVMMIGFK